jgi:ABC-type branched-subunit amino acid transport system ATPase component
MARDVFPELRTRPTRKADALSGGERRMPGIARALFERPRLPMADEPTERVRIGAADPAPRALRQSRSAPGQKALRRRHVADAIIFYF